MARDAYHEIFFHLVWHTKESRNLIAPDMEQELYDIIRQRALQPGGVYVHEIGGTRNHVHVAVRVPPTLLMSEWIGRVKGGNSHNINHESNLPLQMDWQSGYGIVSFGAKDLQWVVEYIRNQKQHHYAGTVFDRLERINQDKADG